MCKKIKIKERRIALGDSRTANREASEEVRLILLLCLCQSYATFGSSNGFDVRTQSTDPNFRIYTRIDDAVGHVKCFHSKFIIAEYDSYCSSGRLHNAFAHTYNQTHQHWLCRERVNFSFAINYTEHFRKSVLICLFRR